MQTIILASRNKGKIRELAVLLEPFGVTVKGLDAYPEIGDIEETGTSFAENALLKASTVSDLTGRVAVADDSGLEVDYLGGEPGVYSARFAEEGGLPATDERNMRKLLEKMRGVPDKDRACRFVSVMAAASPDKRHIMAEGRWEGILACEPRGTNGFGYDPVFFDPVTGKTAAESTPEEKNARSHRARACKKLLELWPSFFGDRCGGQSPPCSASRAASAALGDRCGGQSPPCSASQTASAALGDRCGGQSTPCSASQTASAALGDRCGGQSTPCSASQTASAALGDRCGGQSTPCSASQTASAASGDRCVK